MKLKKEEVPQFVGQLIDVFEAFLEEKGIDYNSEDLRGEDSDWETSIKEVLEEWKLVRSHKED